MVVTSLGANVTNSMLIEHYHSIGPIPFQQQRQDVEYAD